MRISKTDVRHVLQIVGQAEEISRSQGVPYDGRLGAFGLDIGSFWETVADVFDELWEECDDDMDTIFTGLRPKTL